MRIRNSPAATESEVVSGVLVPAVETPLEQQWAEQLLQQAKTDGMTVEVWRPVLASRDLRLWFLSRSISFAGTVASAVALPLLTYQISNSPALTAAVVGLEALPYLLFGLFAGAAADRLRRKAMMVNADLACAALLATVPLLLRTMLGLEPVGDHLVENPAMPAAIGEIELLDMPGRWGRTDAFGRGHINVETPGGLRPQLGAVLEASKQTAP